MAGPGESPSTEGIRRISRTKPRRLSIPNIPFQWQYDNAGGGREPASARTPGRQHR